MKGHVKADHSLESTLCQSKFKSEHNLLKKHKETSPDQSPTAIEGNIKCILWYFIFQGRHPQKTHQKRIWNKI